MEIATLIISQGKISLDHKLGVFTVLGSTEPRVVRLNPSPTFSCPSRSNCYHIMAAIMAVGLREIQPSRQLNLTQLRRNVRSRPDKMTGRKRPWVNDIDVAAAGDHDHDADELRGFIVEKKRKWARREDDVDCHHRPASQTISHLNRRLWWHQQRLRYVRISAQMPKEFAACKKEQKSKGVPMDPVWSVHTLVPQCVHLKVAPNQYTCDIC